MKQVKKLQLLTILAIIGCVNNGYTKYETTLPVISNNITVNKQNVDKVINNNDKIIDVNKYNKQLSINEQLDNRINECYEVISSINNDILKEEMVTNKLKRELNRLKQSKTEPKTIVEKGRKITEELNDIDNVATAKLNNLKTSIKTIEQYIDILKVLKNTRFFQNLVGFVQDNSSKLLKGECIDFSTVFKFDTEITKSLNKIYCWAENEKALEHTSIQEFLMYEALAMCPNLGIKSILQTNNGEVEEREIAKGGLIHGIKTKDGRSYYGFSAVSTYSIGLDLTNCF